HVAALQAHLGSQIFFRVDIDDFFGSIKRSRITRVLKPLFGYEQAREWAIASSVQFPGDPKRTILPFGFVQSPLLASLCLRESALGRFLERVHKKGDVKVSVYVDDIVLSSSDPRGLGAELIEALRASAKRSRFSFGVAKAQGPGIAIEAFN